MTSSKAVQEILMSFSAALLLLTGWGGAEAGSSPAAGVAIRGYDAVAYFTAGKALKGSESFSFSWHGMTWLFSSDENRDRFTKDPEKYAPQYDGYCAWAMTEGRKALTDPEV